MISTPGAATENLRSPVGLRLILTMRAFLGVDHRNQHVIAFVDAVRFKQVQLAHHVLCSGAVWHRVRSDRKLGLRSDVELVGLASGEAREIPPYQAQSIGNRAAAIDVPAADGPPG